MSTRIIGYGRAPAHRDLTTNQRAQNTRANQLRSSSGPTPVSPIVKPAAEWRRWIEVSVRLKGLLPSATTLSLWKDFSSEGELELIDIFEDFKGQREGTGRLIFRPPPKVAFWARNGGRYEVSNNDGTRYLVRVLLDGHRPDSGVPSPIRKNITYSSQLKLFPDQLDFGMMENDRTIMTFRRILQNTSEPIAFSVDLKRRRIRVKFDVAFIDPRIQGVQSFASSTNVGENDRVNTYMFQIPFGQLKKMKYLDYDQHNIDDFFGLVISLESPPQFYRKQIGPNAGHAPGNLTWNEFDTWYRQTDVDYDPRRLQTAKVGLHKDQPDIDIGRWTTYLFTFRKSITDLRVYNEMKQALQDFNIEIVTATDSLNWEPRPAEFWNLVDPPFAKDTVAELLTLEPEEMSFSLPFEVRYQLEVCISRGFINEHNITRDFIKELALLSFNNSRKARNLLEYVAEQEQRVFEPMSIFTNQAALAFCPRMDIPHYCAYVRKATITPTTIYFSTPIVETTNRVLRHYSRENLDGRFLRVQFTDEIFEGKINSTKKTRNDELYTRVYRALFNGIEIGDRHFQFLAFGNSQFRENGAYFFCKTDSLSCDDIRAWMGSFTHIDVVAKYAARLGQCFSTTRAINGLSHPTLIAIEDVHRNGYCFTDGVGKISPFMAQMIATELGIQGNTAPSAFQFRLGGCKGIVVVWPQLKEKEVHIRPSQQKFAATYNGFEVIKCAQFSSASLNRQTITILSALGVADEVFLTMLSEQLMNYKAAMEDGDLAVSLLCRYIDDTQMTINIATMIRNGFMAQKDPFVISLLHLWRAWSIRLLKEKAKLMVEDGAFVLGCVDETATLRGYINPPLAHGEHLSVDHLPQIFIQVPDKVDHNQYRVIEGVCLVGRNPSLHPGDLRVVQAVDVPSLRHIRNVVVFPQNGDRDIPGMCSGGDLDGDDYFVFWDKNLRPADWNCRPMDYSPPPPKRSKRPVKITDLMKFFVVFMKNDSLPTIAHAHLAQADYLENSVFDTKCLELAQLHSKAVDYPKSGQPAEMPKYLAPRKWPHFMEKHFKPKEHQYTSQKILGQLYDKVESVKFMPQWEHRFDPRILKAYKLDDAMLKTIRQVKSQYDTAMRRILANQEIGSEFEVWSTFVLSKPRAGNDYKYQEEVARLSATLKDQYRAICIEKAGSEDFDVLGPFAAGMYKVTKEELDIALAECRATKLVAGREVPRRKMEPKHMPLISFPWLFEKELGRVATGMDATTTMEELGLLPLDYRTDGNARKRQGGAFADLEDFVQQEDGVIVHRGQELDLFRPDIEDLSDGDYFEESEAKEDGPDMFAEAGRIVQEFSDTESIAFGGTGVEDVVKPAELQGLINPQETVRRLHEQSAFLPALASKMAVLHPRSQPDTLNGQRTRDAQAMMRDHVLSIPTQLDVSQLRGLHKMTYTGADGNAQPTSGTIDGTMNNIMENQDNSTFKGSSRSEETTIDELRGRGKKVADEIENSEYLKEYEEVNEIEQVEEILDLPIRESVFDRLARMQRF